MGQKINTLKPDPVVHGEALQRGSVSGRKTQFALQSTTTSGSFSVTAGSTSAVSVALNLWPTDMPVIARGANNIVSYSNCVAWPEFNIWIDSVDDNHYYGASTLTAGQAKVNFSHMRQLSPYVYSGSTGSTASDTFNFFNTDGSNHTVYITITYKYIIIGDANL